MNLVAAVAILTLLTALIACARWLRPRIKKAWRTLVAAVATLAGTEEIRHKITNEVLVPAQPGVGVQVADLAVAVTKLVELHAQTAELQATAAITRATLTDHGNRLTALEMGAIERILNRADSVAAWQAMGAATDSPRPERPDPPAVD